jgi:hypothetical protein
MQSETAPVRRQAGFEFDTTAIGSDHFANSLARIMKKKAESAHVLNRPALRADFCQKGNKSASPQAIGARAAISSLTKM